MKNALPLLVLLAAPPGAQGTSAVDPLNVLEVEAGWLRLFNGTDTQGWRAFAGTSFPTRGWSVREGCLVHAKGGGGGDVVTTTQYRNFELELEWRVAAGGNSGVKYRVKPSSAKAMLGPEYQVLDDGGTSESDDPEHAAGALYDVVPAGWKALEPAGSFNRARIVARDSWIEHWVNGERVVLADLASPDWSAALEASKFAGVPDFARGAGHIGLQDHGDEVWFRDLRLRDWDALPGRSVTLFDGDDLDAWQALGDAVYRPLEGSILGEVGGGGQSFLVTRESFGDFLFEVDVKPELPGNSGLQVRSHVRNPGTRKQRLYGYQIEIDSSERAWSGGLYDEARRGWLDDLSDNEAGRVAFRYGEWNRYRIECLGPWIRAWVNGVPTADYMDCQDMEGVIGLQVHSGNNTRVRWANLKLHDLGTRSWEDVLLVKAEGGRLVLSPKRVESWGDFALRLSFDPGKPFVLGLRAKRGDALGGEVEERVPGLRRHLGANPGWSVDPFAEPLRELHVEGTNELTLACYGRRVAVHLNGKLAFDARGLEGALEGMVGLWGEGWTNVRCLGSPRHD